MSEASSATSSRSDALAAAVGTTYAAPAPYAVSREKIAEFAAALRDQNPAYLDPDVARGYGHADVVAPPTFAIIVAFGLLDHLFADPRLGLALHRIMHADQRFVLDRAICAGDRLDATLTIERTRQMGGADLIFTRTDLVAAGHHVGAAYATVVHQPESTEQPDAGQPDAGDQAAVAEGPADDAAGVDAVADGTTGDNRMHASRVPAADAIETGAELPPLRVALRRSDLVRYAGASKDFNPIHWSDRVATSVGLPGVVAHGMLTMAQAARVVTDWVGDPGRVVEYATRFTKPVLVPDDDRGTLLEVSGVVGALEDDGRARIDLAAHVGDTAVLGRARTLVQLA